MGVGVVGWVLEKLLFYPPIIFSFSTVGLRCVILDFMEFTSFPSLPACLLVGRWICADWFGRLHTVSERVGVICGIDLFKRQLEGGGKCMRVFISSLASLLVLVLGV